MENNTLESQIGNFTYKIKKMSAQAASCFAPKYVALFNGPTANVSDYLLTLEDADFKKLQDKLLPLCFYTLPTGIACVIDEMGNVTIPCVTAPDLLTLTIDAFRHNMSDFFDKAQENRLGESLAELLKTIYGQSSTTPSVTDTGNNTSSGTELTA